MARLGFALLCHAATPSPPDRMSILDAGMRHIGVPQLPFTLVVSFALQWEWDRSEIGRAHDVSVRISHESGEQLAAREYPAIISMGNPHVPATSTMIEPFTLELRRDGRYDFTATLNGKQLARLPLTVAVGT